MKKENNKAWVICNNDYPQMVVIGDMGKAESERVKLETESHAKHGTLMNFWHMHKVPLVDFG